MKSVTYYDGSGSAFAREDYIQAARHKVTANGQVYDLKNVPHEHLRTIMGPNGPYKKEMVRILDKHRKPITEWVNAAS